MRCVLQDDCSSHIFECIRTLYTELALDGCENRLESLKERTYSYSRSLVRSISLTSAQFSYLLNYAQIIPNSMHFTIRAVQILQISVFSLKWACAHASSTGWLLPHWKCFTSFWSNHNQTSSDLSKRIWMFFFFFISIWIYLPIFWRVKKLANENSTNSMWLDLIRRFV